MNHSEIRFSPIARLRALLNQPTHDYRPATTVFLDLNVDRIADEMNLTSLGKERGSQNRPASDAQTLDDVEHLIVERIEAHKQDSHTIYLDHLHTYDERITALSFEERFAVIQQAAPEAVGDFEAEATMGRDELFTHRRRLNESELERDAFRKRHHLERPARLLSSGTLILKVGLLAILFAIEVVVNAGFLAKSNTGGYIGAAIQAATFAALNILASFLWGLVLIRPVFHRNVLLKLVGVVFFLAYLAFAAALNLTLGHLREMRPELEGDVGQVVLHRLLTSPLDLTDVNSWVFISIGLVFSLVAMADGLTFFDPYIGYAGLERRWVEASQQFTNLKSDLIERLRDIRQDSTDVMNAASSDLSKRRADYDSILLGRSRLSQRFNQHQNQVEQAARALLGIYREANRKSRSTPAPAYFDKPFTLERITYAAGEPDSTARERLRQMIEETQGLLKEQVKAVNEAFERAMRSYREIDQFFPEDKNG
ncbi:hypothetical protein J2R76_007406 [Bradyrhizobium sp. USDA 4532]|uniref:hypothetical protein n=1 Tax=unclassified Bradyrhizobium TaxID=2631580 RepID=UPI00209D855C|nr:MULTISPECIES: hypothetical protein [unclassified Bradyrhizobium]MCP1830706.1 hypothetical protein [Bradyrhizobium sp. USDA 4545]MCP1923815.1 hypothetical protein [Bradyrhizobium sp. USDA 4532]